MTPWEALIAAIEACGRTHREACDIAMRWVFKHEEINDTWPASVHEALRAYEADGLTFVNA